MLCAFHESVGNELQIERRAVALGRGQDLSELRREADHVTGDAKVERPNAERVSHAQESPSEAVPQAEREIANQFRRTFVAPGLVRRQDEIDVPALGNDASAPQFGDQVLAIVESTIEDQHAMTGTCIRSVRNPSDAPRLRKATRRPSSATGPSLQEVEREDTNRCAAPLIAAGQRLLHRPIVESVHPADCVHGHRPPKLPGRLVYIDMIGV